MPSFTNTFIKKCSFSLLKVLEFMKIDIILGVHFFEMAVT